ncbi:MAG: DUF2892 domain-containing protein [Nitrospirae bacterium]|nr:DUF2892 domain-containing protein [Nitrospirota bacterium]
MAVALGAIWRHDWVNECRIRTGLDETGSPRRSQVSSPIVQHLPGFIRRKVSQHNGSTFEVRPRTTDRIKALATEFRNEANWDRILRILLGVGMLLLGWLVLGEGILGAAFRIFGFVPLVTGLLGWCPFYTLLGFATKKQVRID